MTAINFKVKNVTSPDGSRATLAELNGSINAASVATVQDVLKKLLEKGVRHLILDLQQLDYINSTGLGALLQYVEQYRAEGGDILLCSLTNKVAMAIELLGFDTVFSVYPDQASAMNEVGEKPRVGTTHEGGTVPASSLPEPEGAREPITMQPTITAPPAGQEPPSGGIIPVPPLEEIMVHPELTYGEAPELETATNPEPRGLPWKRFGEVAAWLDLCTYSDVMAALELQQGDMSAMKLGTILVAKNKLPPHCVEPILKIQEVLARVPDGTSPAAGTDSSPAEADGDEGPPAPKTKSQQGTKKKKEKKKKSGKKKKKKKKTPAKEKKAKKKKTTNK